jgi:hypothetical protein
MNKLFLIFSSALSYNSPGPITLLNKIKIGGLIKQTTLSLFDTKDCIASYLIKQTTLQDYKYKYIGEIEGNKHTSVFLTQKTEGKGEKSELELIYVIGVFQ